jgi:YD repeat-containing protein
MILFLKQTLEGDKVTYETDGTNQIYYTYDSAGKLLSMNLNGTDKQRTKIFDLV